SAQTNQRDSLAQILFFFFSSRRRHTRSDRDWSSDVCSSDLPWTSDSRTSARAPRRSPRRSDVSQQLARATLGDIQRPVAEDLERSEERRVGKECRSGGGGVGERIEEHGGVS